MKTIKESGEDDEDCKEEDNENEQNEGGEMNVKERRRIRKKTILGER